MHWLLHTSAGYREDVGRVGRMPEEVEGEFQGGEGQVDSGPQGRRPGSRWAQISYASSKPHLWAAYLLHGSSAAAPIHVLHSA